MKSNCLIWLSLTAILVGCISLSTADGIPYMTADELRGELNNPDLLILDVRRDGDWTGSDEKVVGAVRADPKNTGAWPMDTFKGKTLVLYCA